MTAKSVKTVKPTQKKPKRRIVVSTGFEEFSGRLVPITMIVVGIMVILNCVAYFIQSDAIQYWFLFRNYLNLFGFLIVNSMLGPILISRIGIICLMAGGGLIVTYGVLFYFQSVRAGLQRIVMLAGFLTGAAYMTLYSIAWIQLADIYVYDQVNFQLTIIGLPFTLSMGLWPYFLLVAVIILVFLTLVNWIFPSVQEDLKEVVFIGGAIFVWILAIVDWNKGSLIISTVRQFSTLQLLPSSLFMGNPDIEGTALLLVGVGLIFKIMAASKKENARNLFVGIAGMVYGVALLNQVFLFWSLYQVLFLIIAILATVVASAFILANGGFYFRDHIRKC
ncbi:MAG: hypothetical protein WED07_10335 [Candidatus Freyarchaeum deiterrae]